MSISKRLLIFAIAFFLPAIAFSKDFIPNGPLIARTQNPIYLQTLGQIPTRAAALQSGSYSSSLNMSYTNMFDLGRNTPAGNEVFLDMELARVALDFAYGLGCDMEASLEIPFLHWNGGYFDKFIQDYHKAFGFPNGNRNQYPNGMFRYRVTKNGQIIYNVNRLPIGLSDVILGFKHNFIKEEKNVPAIAWDFRFKLPTGSPSQGSGSGHPDFSIGAAVEKSISRWHFYMNMDLIIANGNDSLSDLYNNQMFAGMAAVELSVSQPVSVIAQIQGSTPLLKGLGINEWDSYPLDLVIGVKGTHKKLFWDSDFFWQWGFTEDLNPNGPSVDITTMLVLGISL